jgi:hypothetical protein
VLRDDLQEPRRREGRRPGGPAPERLLRWSSAPDCDEPGVSVVRIEGATWPLEKRVCAGASGWVYSEPAPEIGTFLRLEWLAAALGGTRDTLGCDATTVVESRWDDAAGRARAVAAARRELAAKHAALVARLVAAGALTAREARGVPCDPELVVDDLRPRHDEPALPEEGPRRAAAIGRLLESADPASIAWGAFHAKRMPGGVGAALPSLCAALGTLRSPETHAAGQESEWEWRRAAGARRAAHGRRRRRRAGARPLPRAAGDAPAGAGLLARAPKHSHDLFVRLEGSEECWEQLLAGNVLAAARAPGFAARLLEQIRFQLLVRVLGPRGKRLACGGSFDTSLDEAAVPEDLPPTPFFRWDHEPSEGGVPVAGRTRPVWLRRAVVDPGRRDGLGDSPCHRIDDATRLGWLRDRAASRHGPHRSSSRPRRRSRSSSATPPVRAGGPGRAAADPRRARAARRGPARSAGARPAGGASGAASDPRGRVRWPRAGSPEAARIDHPR